MKNLFTSALLIGASTITIYAETNSSIEHNSSSKTPISQESNLTKAEKIEKQLQAQMKKEKKYAEEQRFYQGSEHDLSGYEVDPNSLDDIPLIEPDYDFDMDDVYD